MVVELFLYDVAGQSVFNQSEADTAYFENVNFVMCAPPQKKNSLPTHRTAAPLSSSFEFAGSILSIFEKGAFALRKSLFTQGGREGWGQHELQPLSLHFVPAASLCHARTGTRIMATPVLQGGLRHFKQGVLRVCQHVAQQGAQPPRPRGTPAPRSARCE